MDNSKGDITNSTFIDDREVQTVNKISAYLYTTSSAIELNITDCRFENLKSEMGGGAINFRNAHKITVKDSDFIRNVSPKGGAMLIGNV